jgi:hypothetical protein
MLIFSDHQAVHLACLERAAIVAAEQRAARPHGQPVRHAARRGDNLLGAVRPHAGDATGEHLDHDHRAVLHRDGPLGEFQIAGDFLEVHGRLPNVFLLREG